jgi:hypothetical protein
LPNAAWTDFLYKKRRLHPFVLSAGLAVYFSAVFIQRCIKAHTLPVKV